MSSEIQSIILSKDRFPTEASAKRWLSARGYRTGLDSKAHTWRARQASPGEFKRFRVGRPFKTKGVEAVYGFHENPYEHENSVMGWLSGLATIVGLAWGAYCLYSVLHPPFGQGTIWGVTQFAQTTPGTFTPVVGQFAALEDIASGAGVIIMVTALGTAPDGKTALTGQVEQVVSETSTPSAVLPGQTILAHVSDVIATSTSESTLQGELAQAIKQVSGGGQTTTTTQGAVSTTA